MYPQLVKEFCANLRRRPSEIVSSVKGVQLELSMDRMAEIFSLPKHGTIPDKFADKKERSRLIVERDDVVGDVMANTLTLEMRVLHHMVCKIFIPKVGRFDFMSERELMVMFYAVQDMPLSFFFSLSLSLSLSLSIFFLAKQGA